VTKKKSSKKRKRRNRKVPAGELPNAYMCCSNDCEMNYSIVYYAFDFDPKFQVSGRCHKCDAPRCWVSLLKEDRYKYKFGDRYPSIEERTDGLDTRSPEEKV